MEIRSFIQQYREAFGSKAPLPLLFGYSDKPVADTPRIGGCFFKGLQAARDGQPVALSAEVIGCGGGKLYTGFSDMPERVPGFVSQKEKYKKTPEMVVDYIKGLGMQRAALPYLNFIRIDQAESFNGTEGILFFASPDMLSGLCGWGHLFDTYNAVFCEQSETVPPPRLDELFSLETAYPDIIVLAVTLIQAARSVTNKLHTLRQCHGFCDSVTLSLIPKIFIQLYKVVIYQKSTK